MKKLINYFVEGECEKQFLNTLKDPKYNLVNTGKVFVFNVVNKKLLSNRLISLDKNSIIVLIYDTDTPNIDILNKNLLTFTQHGFKNIYHVHSVKNFEDEIVFSTSLQSINDFFNTNSIADFKKKFIKSNSDHLYSKLKEFHFDKNKMWSRRGNTPYKIYETIKIIKK